MKKVVLGFVSILALTLVACSNEEKTSSSSSDDWETELSSSSEEEASASESTEVSSSSSSEEPFDPATYSEVDFGAWNHDDIEKGKKLTFSGKVLQNQKDDTYYLLRVAIGSDYDKVVMVGIPTSIYKKIIAEDDIITVHGVNVGLTEYTTVQGNVRTIPLLRADHYEVVSYGN